MISIRCIHSYKLVIGAKVRPFKPVAAFAVHINIGISKMNPKGAIGSFKKQPDGFPARLSRLMDTAVQLLYHTGVFPPGLGES